MCVSWVGLVTGVCSKKEREREREEKLCRLESFFSFSLLWIAVRVLTRLLVSSDRQTDRELDDARACGMDRRNCSWLPGDSI